MKKKKDQKPSPEKTQKEIEFEQISSLFEKYISGGELITKEATLYGVQRVTYVKGKDLKQFFTKNFEGLKQEVLKITKINIGKEANKDSLQKFYQLNQQRNILHYLQRMPGDKAKYPKKLLPLNLKKGDDINLDLNFSETGFYSLLIKKENTKKPIIYLTLIIIFILFIVLFPIWPLKLKLGVLYFLLGLVIFLTALLILLILIGMLGLSFGYDILIMPYLDDFKLSWKDRLFKQFIYVEKRDVPCWFKALGIIFIISLIMLGAIAYFYPSIPKECYYMVKNALSYIFTYGKKFIEDIHYHRKDIKVRNTKSLDDLNNL